MRVYILIEENKDHEDGHYDAQLMAAYDHEEKSPDLNMYGQLPYKPEPHRKWYWVIMDTEDHTFYQEKPHENA